MRNLFKYEINESVAAKATMNCLKNRNNHKQLNETSDFDARFEFRKDLRELASPTAKKAYMIIRNQYGDGMWRALCMDDCDEQGLIELLNTYAEDGLNPQQIVNKIMGIQEQEETDYTNDEIPSYKFSYQNSFLVWSMRHVIPYLKEISQVCAQADPTELKHAVMNVLKQEGRFAAPDSERNCKDWAQEKSWKVEELLGGSTQEQEEDGINKGGMHNLVQVGHIMNTPSMLDKLDTEYFSDLEEQEAYYENFRAIAELVADQIDRENGKGVDNNMDTLFEIVREVWNNNPDDLYIYDFDEVDEDKCMDFFDKHYEEIKDEYMNREHNNIMDSTHDDLFDVR